MTCTRSQYRHGAFAPLVGIAGAPKVLAPILFVALAAGCGETSDCAPSGASAAADGDTAANLRADGAAVATVDDDGSVEEALAEACSGDVDGGGPRSTLPLPSDAVFASLDGNAGTDVAIANAGTDDVSVFLRSAGTTFTGPVNVATGTRPVAIAAGDFDGGGVDLVTANAGNVVNGDLSLLLGDGAGGFQAPIPLAAGTLPFDVAVGHFDADPHLDVVVADFSSSAVVVRLGNGNGTFQSETSIALGADTRTVVVADINDDVDGYDDIVTNHAILLGNGNGTFQPPVSFAAGLEPWAARVGDVDADGTPDVVAVSKEENLGSILLGNGDGTFQPPRHYVTGRDPRAVSIVDMNADGTADLLVSNFLDDHLSILHGRGDGTLMAVAAYPTVANLGTGGAVAVTVADFTGDDVPDVVAANESGAAFLAGLGDGTLGPPVALPGLSATRIVAGYWDAGTTVDLAFTRPGSPSSGLDVALGDGNGSFAAPSSHALPDDDGGADVVATGLVNDDVFADLVVANTGTGDVSIFLGDGAGGFAAQPTVPIGTMPNGVATGDLNGDTKLDLAVTFQGDFAAQNGGVAIALGNGDGSFQAAQVIRQNVEPDSVVIADVNHDDDLDLAVALEVTTFDWDVEVMLGNGNGTFGAPQRLGIVGNFTRAISVADVDQDGNLDLGVGTGGTKALGLRGKGDGTFEAPLVIDIGRVLAFGAFDLDLDGRLDLVAPTGLGYVGVLLSSLEPTPLGAHVLCWAVKPARAPRGTVPFPQFTKQVGVPVADPLASADVDDARLADLTKALAICNPADKNDEDPGAPTSPDHLERYRTKVTRTKPRQPRFEKRRIAIDNQIGPLTLELKSPADLLVPTSTALGTAGAPPLGDPARPHFRCYKVKVARATRGAPPLPKFAKTVVTVRDQLAGPLQLELKKPTQYCVPADTAGEDPAAFDRPERLVCYDARLARTKPRQPKPPAQTVSTQHQFGEEVLVARTIDALCVPTRDVE